MSTRCRAFFLRPRNLARFPPRIGARSHDPVTCSVANRSAFSHFLGPAERGVGLFGRSFDPWIESAPANRAPKNVRPIHASHRQPGPKKATGKREDSEARRAHHRLSSLACVSSIGAGRLDVVLSMPCHLLDGAEYLVDRFPRKTWATMGRLRPLPSARPTPGGRAGRRLLGLECRHRGEGFGG